MEKIFTVSLVAFFMLTVFSVDGCKTIKKGNFSATVCMLKNKAIVNQSVVTKINTGNNTGNNVQSGNVVSIVRMEAKVNQNVIKINQ